MSRRARFILVYFVLAPPLVWVIGWTLTIVYYWLTRQPDGAEAAVLAGWGCVLALFLVAALQIGSVISIIRNRDG